MYCSHQYLSIEPKKVCHAHFNAYKLQKIVNMNVDISETIKDKELGSQIRFRSLVRSARLLREYATPTLKPTNRPNL